ncbi:response regulator [Fulvivirgaceae bacterium PWU4]|uniref:histidine kinase n=1 Tax=Chryseosolibacter histidini TaxID=2782349 RepID=A0AAP2DRL6_9BACT|nr:ATP-binding protein [Chryseosolibacter histidini]MBT1699687.1 response regulator [Chryseosolibacter histidini]
MANKNKHSLKAVVRKIFAAFLLVSIAIVLALAIARFSFRELMSTVDELSAPNEKLAILNSVFEEITMLDQLQRAEAIKNPNTPYNIFLEQSAELNTMIDSLKKLPWDTAQLIRLNEMKEILSERNKLFFSYLKVKANLLDNREFSVQLDTLAAILQNDNLAIDTTLITTQKKITTTYLRDTVSLKKGDQRSFLKKLFSRKKEQQPLDTPRIKVQEELSVKVDTLAVARQNEALLEIEKIMREMEREQQQQQKKLQRQELELIHSNSLFVNQLLSILHEVEREEFQQMRDNNSHAVSVMSQSISRTNILMLCFFVAAAILVYLIWIDISRSNYYKEQLEKARDEAEELTKIKQRFLANMSHELRTPLQSIIGFAEQLKQKNTAAAKEEAEAIYSSSEHLLHIVNEVLDYSRISSGNFTMAREKFKVMALVREIEAAMRIQADRKHLTFLLDHEKAAEFTLTGDPFRLRQILYNLIGNAIKFTNRGFIKLTVNTVDEGSHVSCAFEVTDSGIGIEKSDLDRIFNQFEQANTLIAKNYGGTGLGLTIVKSLVDVQHGQLEVTSEPGIGSCFRVVLRFEKAPGSLVGKTASARTATPPSFKGKVIVVDDDPLIVRLCALILKKNKIDFSTFNSGRDLLDVPPDAQASHIFLDIRMPDINGVDLCHSLRKQYGSATRFIALTAHVLPEERESLLKEGFDTILPKPFHERELLEVLNVAAAGEEETVDERPNLSQLREMTLGDEMLFQSIVAQFVEETLDDLVRVKEKLSAGNEAAMREIIHKMSGRFAQLGIRSLSEKLHGIERKLVAGYSIDDLAPEISRAAKKADEMIVQIRLTTMEQLN